MKKNAIHIVSSLFLARCSTELFFNTEASCKTIWATYTTPKLGEEDGGKEDESPGKVGKGTEKSSSGDEDVVNGGGETKEKHDKQQSNTCSAFT